ncbi:MAG: putative 3-oxoacyl-[acyl-carrier-protein] reductase [Armatimonadetes bacterium]|nr:putative 3-oxoacyl-[acyl-carrier-protein] reductase [Armatimonadota bacterium]
MARRFAAEAGTRLVLADLRREPLEPLAAELTQAEPLVYDGDLSSEAAVSSLFAQIEERFGRLDVAVNSAGILRRTPFEEITKAEWDQVFSINAGSAFLVSQACCKPMMRQGSGRIINFASIAAQVGGILSGAHYAASKAAVISLTRSVAKYLAPHGVRCNVLAPSGIATEMLDQFDDAQKDALCAGIPVGRFGTPEEIAEVVHWLASPAADYITGQTINVNGGAYLG